MRGDHCGAGGSGTQPRQKVGSQLRFNICGLEDSRLANADVKDLPFRIREKLSDSLQYSSLYWSNHLCFAPDNNDQEVWKSLKEFFEGLCPRRKCEAGD